MFKFLAECHQCEHQCVPCIYVLGTLLSVKKQNVCVGVCMCVSGCVCVGVCVHVCQRHIHIMLHARHICTVHDVEERRVMIRPVVI